MAILVSMTTPSASCVLLADRHHQLIESVRDMLETEFATLFIVATESSLIEGATRLEPSVVVLDLSLVPGRLREILRRLRECSPTTKVVLVCAHGRASVSRFALEAGADAVVLKHSIATDLMVAIDAVMADRRFVSAGMGLPPEGDLDSTKTGA